MGGLARGVKRYSRCRDMHVSKKKGFKNKIKIKLPGQGQAWISFGSCFCCGEGCDNFLTQIGGKLYANVNFLKNNLKGECLVKFVKR